MGGAQACVVLLRGVNLGGRNPLPMAELRAALSEAGLHDVRTYIQTGNIVCTAVDGAAPDSIGLLVHRVLAQRFSLQVPIVVVPRAELQAAVAGVPFRGEAATAVHLIVHAQASDAETALTRSTALASGSASTDRAVRAGRVIYLHTPNGFARSRLAADLLRFGGGTARNLTTVSTLLHMCEDVAVA